LVSYVDDVADGIIAALSKGRAGERYILGGDNLTIKELAALTLEVLGTSKPTLTFPNGFIRALTAFATAVKLPLPYNPAVIPYGIRYWFMDSSKARKELGINFRSAKASLEPTLAWLTSAGYIKAAAPRVPAGAEEVAD